VPSAATLRFGWPRKVAALAMVLLGGAFVVVTITANLFRVGPAFDRLTDGFRPIMTQSNIQTDQQTVRSLAAAGTEIQTKLVPALAQQLHMTPTQVQQMMAQQYPDVAKGLSQVQPISQNFTALLNNLDKSQPLFVSADAIPTSNLPAATVPWSLLAVGLIVAGLGVFVWVSPRARVPIVATIVGAALVALPLSLNLVTKASNADQLNSNLKPMYNATLISNANASLSTLGAMGTQLQQEMLPQLAAQLHLTPAQMQVMLQANFPATAAALQSLPTATTHFASMVKQFDQHLSDYKILKPVAFEPIVWLMIAGGGALFLLGGAGVLITRKR
jgi:hypothetical protein